jgi:hypothetical protein
MPAEEVSTSQRERKCRFNPSNADFFAEPLDG